MYLIYEMWLIEFYGCLWLFSDMSLMHVVVLEGKIVIDLPTMADTLVRLFAPFNLKFECIPVKLVECLFVLYGCVQLCNTVYTAVAPSFISLGILKHYGKCGKSMRRTVYGNIVVLYDCTINMMQQLGFVRYLICWINQPTLPSGYFLHKLVNWFFIKMTITQHIYW